MQNQGFLFAAYSIIWALLFGYVLVLLGRQRGLRGELENLKSERKTDIHASEEEKA